MSASLHSTIPSGLQDVIRATPFYIVQLGKVKEEFLLVSHPLFYSRRWDASKTFVYNTLDAGVR